MGVYIKGMEMPTSCPCELLGIGYDLYCSFAGGIPARVKEYYECCQNDTRPSWCPLVPVPEHGRLIDADARVDVQLYNDELEDYQIVNMSIDDLLDSSWIELQDDPTIIPAEPAEEGE